jgi:hypothetical protein
MRLRLEGQLDMYMFYNQKGSAFGDAIGDMLQAYNLGG